MSKFIKIKRSIEIYKLDDTYRIKFMNSRVSTAFKSSLDFKYIFSLMDGTRTEATIKKEAIKHFSGYDEEELIPLLDSVFTTLLNKNILYYYDHESEKLDENDPYNRQIKFLLDFFPNLSAAKEAHEKIVQSKILIFGCGSVGGNLAIKLVMMGCKNITLFDDDIVEASDLTRHLFFNKKDIGDYKVHSLKKYLLKINKNVNVTVLKEKLTYQSDINSLIKNSTFVINSATDPYIGITTSIISVPCFNNNIPFYVTGGFEAHLGATGELIIPYKTPCPYCYSSHFSSTYQFDKRFDSGTKVTKMEDMMLGGLNSVSMFSSSMGLFNIIKFITGFCEPIYTRGELIFSDSNIHYLDVVKNPDCKFCGNKEEKSFD